MEREAHAGERILLCDHLGEGSADRAAWLASAGLSVHVSSSLRASLEHLREGRPAVVVLDPLAAAGQSEIAAIDAARPGDLSGALLVVVDDEAPIAATVERLRPEERGPWDVVRRGAPRDEFLMRVELLAQQVESLREKEYLRHLATHDDRTDLLRPQVFDEQVRQHFSASQRHHLNMALLLIDLDDFGSVNKRFNHTVGDEIIASVGLAIRHSLRAEDVAARLGGDEFCVLLPYTRKVDAARVVQRLLEHIRAIPGSLGTSIGPLKVSASIGFETFNGNDLESGEHLRLHAEEALRVAKQAGGDRGVYYRNLDAAKRGEVEELADEEHP